MKLEMSITPDYVPHWDVNAALREFLQNALDAQRDGHLMEITSDDEWTYITNFGANLPLKTLLLGASSKANDDEAIGQFGEGYKLGCLVLARQGIEMKIASDQGTLTPLIEHSDAYQTEVLKFEIDTDDKCYEGIRISFGKPITKSWLRSLILTEDPFTPRILKDQPGAVYLNGLRLALEHDRKDSDEHWHWGYNIPAGLKLDRDRQMVSLSSLESSIVDVIEGAGTIVDLYTAMKGPIPEFKNVGSYQISYEKKQGLYNLFMEDHGEKSFAVSPNTDTERKDLVRSAGFIPLTVKSEGFRNVIGQLQPSWDDMMKLSNEHVDDYEVVELNFDQAYMQEQVIEILSREEFKGTRLTWASGSGTVVPVVFTDHLMRALFDREKSTMYVSLKAYASTGELLETFIHELTHQQYTGHGKDFLDAFEQNVCLVFRSLIREKP